MSFKQTEISPLTYLVENVLNGRSIVGISVTFGTLSLDTNDLIGRVGFILRTGPGCDLRGNVLRQIRTMEKKDIRNYLASLE